jgi:mono/diheme cytochrome c family protein
VNRKSWLNWALFAAVMCTGFFSWLVKARDVSRPNYDFLPETQMAYSVAYDSFSPNPSFPDGLTLRSPPMGTIPRGQMPLHYQPTSEDALRAGQELQNPYSVNDESRRRRGGLVFANFCQVCHGPIGQGNGPMTQAGFPPPASLLAERAAQMKDGEMFHVLTFGQRNMPAFATQLSREDRWSAILHVRMLQGSYAPSSVPSRSQEVAKLFRENCVACHGEDGAGNRVRKAWPGIPDFTSLGWHMSQTEMAIVNQIQYGSSPLMPAFRHKLTPLQIGRLAVYVRSFSAHPSPAQLSPSNLTAAAIFGTYCFACHDTTGRGNPLVRPAMPELPDFTAVAWHKSRTDNDLAQSILLGKGKFMPLMSDKLGTVDVKQMVSFVRGFQGGKQVVSLEVLNAPRPSEPVVVRSPATTRPVLGASAVGLMAFPPGQGPFLAVSAFIPSGPSSTIAAKPLQQPKDEHALTSPAEDTAAGVRMGESIFRQYCFVCHGLDGKGTTMRPTLPPIPDFTSPTFHKEHSDAQLLISILEGKGTLMPANRGRVTEDQARDLVAYVRTFGPSRRLASEPSALNSEFMKSFAQLEQRWNELQKELESMKGQK